jgi:hypothetical protein
MALTDRAEFTRLILQIERGLPAQQANLSASLTAAAPTVARHRQTRRTVNARVQRARRVKRVRTPR